MMKRYELLTIVFVTLFFLGCDKKCDDFDPLLEYNEVCDILNSKELNISCDETISFEDQEIGIVGKLDPDFLDYLNEYHPNFPDTWPSFFRVLDSSTKEGDDITSSNFIDDKVIQVSLWNDGVNASSFVPLKEQLEVLFQNKAFHTIKIKGIAKGVDMHTNANCNKGLYIELDRIEGVIIE